MLDRSGDHRSEDAWLSHMHRSPIMSCLCLCLCYEINDHTTVCTTSTFSHITPHFYANKILFYSCPHIRQSAPIAFRKKYYKNRHVYHVTLSCQRKYTRERFPC